MTDRIYTFKCSECSHIFEYDQPGEPLCTGPGSVDVHEPKVMIRVRVRDRNRDKNVSPQEGRERLSGPLLVPEVIMQLGLRKDGKLWTPKEGAPPSIEELRKNMGHKDEA